MPLLAFGVVVARGPQTSRGTAPSIPVASFNMPLTPEQVERRIIGVLAPALPTAPPPIRGAPPGSIQLAALKHPPPLPYLPSTTPVSVPPLVVSLGTPLELRAPLTEPALHSPPPATAPTIAAVPSPALLSAPEQCVARTEPLPRAGLQLGSAPADFATALVAAALEQTDGVAVYQARYVRIAYPGGDVSSFYGVCTDVVIRAYRALGIDLQTEVQKARVGRGDTSIDHRRTETLRLFFARMGEPLPVTDFAEDYQPGDIVTYYRPQNRSSTAHIAIVSDVMAPSGRPMIIHNRGFGVQLEDGLFVDKITGHYRYRGPPEPVAVASAKPKSPTLTRVALRTSSQSRAPSAPLGLSSGVAITPSAGR